MVSKYRQAIKYNLADKPFQKFCIVFTPEELRKVLMDDKYAVKLLAKAEKELGRVVCSEEDLIRFAIGMTAMDDMRKDMDNRIRSLSSKDE